MTEDGGAMTGPRPLGVRANIVWYAIPRLLSKGASVLLLPLYTRVLAPAEMGVVAVVLALSGIVGLILTPGLEGVYLRWAFQQPGADASRRAAGTICVIHVASLSASVAALLAGAGLLGAWLIPGVPLKPYYYLMLVSVVLDSLAVPVQAAWRSQHRADKVAALGLAQFAVSTAVILVSLLVFRWGPASILIGECAAASCALPLSLGRIARGLRQGWDRRLAKEVLPLALAGFPMSVSIWALTAVDRLLLNRWAGPAEAGLYSVGYQVTAAVVMAAVILNKEWQLLVFQFAREGALQAGQLQQLWARSLRLFLGLGGLVALCADQIARWVLGGPYQACASLIPVLLIAGVLRVGHFFLVNLGLASGAASTLAFESLMAAGVFIAANVALIPRFGASGAAWAGVCAYAASWLFLCSRRWNVFRIDRSLAPWVLLFAACLVLGRAEVSLLLPVMGAALAAVLWREGRAYWAFLGAITPAGAER